MPPVSPQNSIGVNGKRRNKSASRICQGAASPSFGPLGRVSCWSPLGARPGVLHAPNPYLFSSRHHFRVWVLLRFILEQCRRSSVCETPLRDQYSFDCNFSVLACVLGCTCRGKPSWRGHSCDTGDNQRSSGVVIARSRSFGALDHQRRDLHFNRLYLTSRKIGSNPLSLMFLTNSNTSFPSRCLGALSFSSVPSNSFRILRYLWLGGKKRRLLMYTNFFEPK